MKIDTEYSSGTLRVRLFGELDHHTAQETLESVCSAAETALPRDLILDMEGLSFMDSSGIAVIVRTMRKMQHIGGRLWIENPSPQPLKVLDASGIERLVPVKTKREVTT